MTSRSQVTALKWAEERMNGWYEVKVRALGP